MAEYHANTLTTEAHSGAPARADQQPRASRCPGKYRTERPTRSHSSSDLGGFNGYAGRFTHHQENEEEDLETSSLTEAVLDPRIQGLPPNTLTRRRNPGRGGRGRRQSAASHCTRATCNSTTGYDSGSRSRSDAGSTGGIGVDGGGRHNAMSKSQEGADHGIQSAGPAVSGSSTGQRGTMEGAATAATAASTQPASGIVPDVAKQAVPLSTTIAPLAFSEAVNPFSFYRLPKRRSPLHRATPFTFLFPGKNMSCGISLRLPPLFVSMLSLIKDRASLVPPVLGIPVIFFLLFICVTLSVHVLLLLSPLHQTSFRLHTQLSYDKSQAQNSSIRYCEHSQPVVRKSPASAKEKLPSLPLPPENFTGGTGRWRGMGGCQPCPEHADCSRGRVKCSPPYVRIPAATATKSSFFTVVIQAAKKVFRWELKDGDVCVENEVARRTAEKVVERIVLVLKKRAGDAQCGSLKVCDKPNTAGQPCHDLTEFQKDPTKEKTKVSKAWLSAPDGTMTRWELLQSEELHGQLEDDDVYAYVFDRFLEEQAALRLNVEVRQRYSFESMRLPRENVATSAAAKDFKQDDIVALFLREQRRSQGITYSYTYIGPHAVRSPFCVLRLVFTNTIVPLSFVITALSALAFPVAVWLRRFYLRRQLMIIMLQQQQQQAEQQKLIRSRQTQRDDLSPVVYCGCSSAHLSQLLVQKTFVHRFSLLRWWLQRTAMKIEEVDSMCFELLYNKSACVQTVKHEEQNFWWIAKDISPLGEHTTGESTSANTTCPQAQAAGPDQQLIKSLSLNRSQAACGLLQAPANAADSLFAPQLSTPRRLSYVSSSCPGATTHASVCSYGVCEPSRTSFHVEGRGSIQQADAYVSAMRCSASTPGPCFAASTGDSLARSATADSLSHGGGASPFLRDTSRFQLPSCTSSTIECCPTRPFRSRVASSQCASEQATGSGWSVEANKACQHGNNSGRQPASLNLPHECAGSRRSNTGLSADYSFSAFLARVSDMQQKKPARSFANRHAGHGDSEPPYCATAELGRGRSSVV